jgi:hypothetical protein
MKDHCYIKRFTFDQSFQPYQIDEFLVDFFNNNPSVRVLCSGDRWGTMGRVSKIEKEQTLHSVTSLSFFDRLKKGIRVSFIIDVMRCNGDIKKCLDEYYESYLISGSFFELIL